MLEKLGALENVKLGFLFALVLVTIAVNANWRHYIRYWIRDLNQPRRVVPVRVLFAVALAGSVWKFFEELTHQKRELESLSYALVDGLVVIAIVSTIDLIVRIVLGPPK
jgi:hypothetical protein